MRFTTLIVDDEPLAREGLRMWLSADPDVSSIQEAKDGREALAVIRANRPDLIFLDVQMPEMDGFSVVDKIGAPSGAASSLSTPPLALAFGKPSQFKMRRSPLA